MSEGLVCSSDVSEELVCSSGSLSCSDMSEGVVFSSGSSSDVESGCSPQGESALMR